jgi:hypothetical protein
MSKPRIARIGSALVPDPARDPAPEPIAWQANPRMTVFSKDYLSSATRERLPLPVRVAFDLFYVALREGGVLRADARVVLDAQDACPGLVDAVFVPDGDGFLAFRNDWCDMPRLCDMSREYSRKQSERVSSRYTKGSSQ